MTRTDPRLEQLFIASLSLAAAACGATQAPPDDGSLVGTAQPVASTTSSSAPRPTTSVATSLPPDDSTPEGYARAYRSAGHFEAALSGLELVGFAEVVDDALVCEGGRPCPSAWDKLKDGTFQRAAIVKKRATLSAISGANFFQWVGPIDGPERAALRASVEPRRLTTTCAKLVELGYACAPGSEPGGIPVRQVKDGWEVATFDNRNVCDHGGWGMAVSLGALVVDREGNATDVSTILTQATDAKVRDPMHCQYAIEGRRYEGFVDADCDGSTAGYLARSMREEAAAAVAFDRMAEELAAHGAPSELVRGAREAAEDERRHTRMFEAELARVVSGAVAAAARASLEEEGSARPTRARPLVDMLIENASEGCASETFAAVVATHRGQHAASARHRATFTKIARDEQSHAALSHRIHAWGRSVLAVDERRVLDAAFASAVETFRARGALRRSDDRFGAPRVEVARAAFGRVVASLTAAAPLA